jgi:tryptophanyl-tRNA synthetase
MSLDDKPQTDPNDQPIQPKEQIVKPFTIEAADEPGVDYNKVVEQFGTHLIDQATLDRFEKLTGQKAHRYLRRGLFFRQRRTLAIFYV